MKCIAVLTLLFAAINAHAACPKDDPKCAAQQSWEVSREMSGTSKTPPSVGQQSSSSDQAVYNRGEWKQPIVPHQEGSAGSAE